MLFIQSGTAFKGMNSLPVGGGGEFIPLREVAISKGTQLIKKKYARFSGLFWVCIPIHAVGEVANVQN